MATRSRSTASSTSSASASRAVSSTPTPSAWRTGRCRPTFPTPRTCRSRASSPRCSCRPAPGTRSQVVRGEEFRRALYFDRMERSVAIGLTRTGEAVHANLEFLDGTRGAHASISGVSGVATKTSLRDASSSIPSSTPDALGLDAANAKALIFNVKGEDLLWLDKPNAKLTPEIARGVRQARPARRPVPERRVLRAHAQGQRHAHARHRQPTGGRQSVCLDAAGVLPRTAAALCVRGRRGRARADSPRDLARRAGARAGRARGRSDATPASVVDGTALRVVRRPRGAARRRRPRRDDAAARRSPAARSTRSGVGCTPPPSAWAIS